MVSRVRRPVRISVVIATFGDPWWERLARRRAVPSVCAQTVQPLEVIRQHGDTLHGARNAGAARAQGDWLGFLDADDEIDVGYLAAMRAAAEREQLTDMGTDVKPCALLVPAVAYVRNRARVEPARMLDPGQPMTKVNRCVIGTLVPKWLFDITGGFRSWEMYEDWDLWLSCLERGAELVDVPAAIYRAWTRRDSRNRRPRADAIRVYDAIRADHGLTPPCREYDTFGGRTV